MTRRLALSKQGFALVMSGLLVSCSTMAFAQHRTGGGGREASSGGRSSGGDQGGRGGSSNGGHSGGGQPSRGEHTGSTRDGESGQASGHAVPRSAAPASTNNPSGAAAATGATRESSRDSSPSESGNDRSRDSRPVVGHAVERPPYYSGGGSTVIVTRGYGSYYPWGYGGLGFGGYNGYYDPWWDPYPPVYAGGYGYGYGDEGALRLKVKPRDASVYVDGYFAGQVDDFDGVFQKLKIEPGPHRVEIHMDGYEPLTFEVRIMPDRKTTYSGEMKELP